MLGNLDKLQKDTNSTITKKDFEIQVLKESLYTLERERDDLKAKSAQLTRHIEESDSNKDQYRRTTEKHTRSLEDLKAQVSRMEQKIYELDSQKNKLIEENTELAIKLQDADNEIETADKELEFLRAKISKLKEKNGKDLELKRDYKGLLQRVEALEKEELKYNSEKSEYLAEIQILKERNEGLYIEIYRMKEGRKKRRLNLE